MKKLTLSLVLVGIATLAQAANLPTPNLGTGTLINNVPLMSGSQINPSLIPPAGAFPGVSGDCTSSGSSTISLTCTKTNGSTFAPSATTDTTNFANITRGFVGVGFGGTGCTTASFLCLDNITGASGTGIMSRTGPGAYVFASLSSLLDSSFGSAQGSILYRGASGWAVLAPGAAGQYLQTAGPGVNPSWQTQSAGRVLLNTLNASNTPVLSDSTDFTSTYNEYDIYFENLIPSTSANGRIQVQVDGAYQNSKYSYSYFYNDSGSNGGSASTSGTYIPASNFNGSVPSTGLIYGHCHFSNVSSTNTYKPFVCEFMNATTAPGARVMSGGWYNGSQSALTGVQFSFSSGNIASGTVKIYGSN